MRRVGIRVPWRTSGEDLHGETALWPRDATLEDKSVAGAVRVKCRKTLHVGMPLPRRRICAPVGRVAPPNVVNVVSGRRREPRTQYAEEDDQPNRGPSDVSVSQSCVRNTATCLPGNGVDIYKETGIRADWPGESVMSTSRIVIDGTPRRRYCGAVFLWWFGSARPTSPTSNGLRDGRVGPRNQAIRRFG